MRRVLQHLVFVALLTLRLWTLPLLYLCCRISRPIDMLPAPTWRYMIRFRGATTGTIPTRFRRPGSESLYATGLRLFHSGVATPIRVLRALYNFGYVLDQHPDMLRYGRPFFAEHNMHDDDQTVSMVESEAPDEFEDGSEVEAPATASQFYHAAIMNGGTLDNLLAGFEVPEQQRSLDQTSGEEGDHQAELARSPYRNGSIQRTPSSAMTPRNSSKILQEPNQGESSAMVERTYGHLVKAIANDSQPKQDTGSPDLLSSTAGSNCCQSGGEVGQGAVCENMSADHTECPTFARRQAKSRLPQRIKSEARQRISTDMRAVSANVNVNADSPSRRNKLQRRPRVVG